MNLISAVGDDQFGAQLLKQTTDAGVKVDEVICTSQNSTGSYIGVIDSTGELQIAMDDMHAIKELTPKYLRDRYELFKKGGEKNNFNFKNKINEKRML